RPRRAILTRCPVRPERGGAGAARRRAPERRGRAGTGLDPAAAHVAGRVRGLEGRHFRGELEELLGLPVTLDNDINLAARGEQWLGVARGVDDFVFLSIGTGLGAGLVLRGELHRGRNGA